MAGIPAVLLVFGLGLLFAGCDNGTTGDTWKDITSFDQLDGTWKGFYSQDNVSIIDLIEGEGLPPEMQGMMQTVMQDIIQSVMKEMSIPPFLIETMIETMLASIKASIKADILITIDASAKTQAMSITPTLTFSGVSDLIWFAIKAGLGSSDVKFDDKNHSVAMSFDDLPATALPDDLLTKGLQINQNGRKIKVPADSLVPGMPEMIFEKQ